MVRKLPVEVADVGAAANADSFRFNLSGRLQASACGRPYFWSLDMARHRFVDTPDPIYIETEKEARTWAKYFSKHNEVGYDTETTGLHKINDRIKFFSFGVKEARIAAPVRLLPFFKDILESPDIGMCMTNAKFDMHMTKSFGIHIRGEIWDTLVMDWQHDENRQGQHGLKQTAKDYLHLRMAPFKEVFGSVGSVDKEVKMVTYFHDALEARDAREAANLLVQVRKVDGEESVLKALQSLAISQKSGHMLGKSSPLLASRGVLAIARKHGLAPKTGGTAGYVSDFCQLLGGPPIEYVKTRKEEMAIMSDMGLIAEAHEVVIRKLMTHIKVDREPLAFLRLLVSDYASLDAWASFMLVQDMRTRLEDEVLWPDEGDAEFGVDYPSFDITHQENYDYNLLDLYKNRQLEFTKVLWNMERRGLSFSADEATDKSFEVAEQVEELDREIIQMTGREINLNSPAQKMELFYTKNEDGEWEDPFGNPPKYWTKGGASGIKAPSTNKDALAEWAERGDDLAKAVQSRTKLNTLNTNFLVKLPREIDRYGRIHTSLKQQGTVTGRLCVAADTELVTTGGTFCISELPDPKTQNLSIQTHTGAMCRITHKIYKGIEQMYRVELRNGAAIVCTANHRFQGADGWVKLKELSVGDRLYTDSATIKGTTSRRKISGPRRGELSADLGRGHPRQRKDLQIPRSRRNPACTVQLKKVLQREVRAANSSSPCEEGSSGLRRSDQRYTESAIQAITPLGEEEVWDVQVEGDHSYLAHGFVNHNSSADPNLQNMPSRGDLGRMFRKLFSAGLWGDVDPDICHERLRHIAPPKLDKDHPMILIVADYAQLEMRIMAHFSECTGMMDAIWNGEDLHSKTAGLTGKAEYAAVVAAKAAVDNGSSDPADLALVDIRSAMKAIGFGLLYGIGAVKLGSQLGLEVISEFSKRSGRTFEKCPAAEDLIEAYFTALPEVREHIDYLHDFAQEHMYVQTFLGRKRRLPAAASSNRREKAQALRQSVNSVIQGTAADITNTAMMKAEGDKLLRQLGCRQILQIHDELIFEVPKDPKYIEPAQARIVELMEDPFPMRVPIAVSSAVADLWGDAH